MDFYTASPPENAANKAENFKIQPCCWPGCHVPAHLRIVRFNIEANVLPESETNDLLRPYQGQKARF